jgi:hypothetical protein
MNTHEVSLHWRETGVRLFNMKMANEFVLDRFSLVHTFKNGIYVKSGEAFLQGGYLW